MANDAAKAEGQDDTPRVVWGAKAFAITFHDRPIGQALGFLTF